MQKQTAILLTTLCSCKERKFLEVKNLAEFQKTQFIPTLEYKISNDKNAVYCATLLFAWDEVRKQINSPLKISDKYLDLKLLNQSRSFMNVLKSNEYNVESEIDSYSIKAKAEFNKSLPFETKLSSFNNKLMFDKQKIASFGVTGNHKYEQLKNVEIIYYKNDKNFIIKLCPKDEEHEIILFKTEQNFNSIGTMADKIKELTKIGKVEKENEKINWKYSYGEDDEVVIPKFNFNIETNYASLEGNSFDAGNQNYRVEKAWQRTAFILDENGAEIESKSFWEALHSEAMPESPKPKKMIFDKPFLLLLKRTDAINPYLGLWVANAELLQKE